GLEHAEHGTVVVPEKRVGTTALEDSGRDHDLAAVSLHIARRRRRVVHRHQGEPAAALGCALAARTEMQSADVASFVFDQRVSAGAPTHRMKVPAEHDTVERLSAVGIGGHAIEPYELAGQAC